MLVYVVYTVGTLQGPRPVLLLASFPLKVEVEKGSSIILSTREFAIVRGGNLICGWGQRELTSEGDKEGFVVTSCS